jgi:acetamidase/formamidase
MAIHELKPIRANLHGYFSKDLPPVLTVDSGDAVLYELLDAGWNFTPRTGPETAPVKFEPRFAPDDNGHCLCGPIAIHGAEPGMTVAIHFESIIPASHGWTVAGGWDHPVNRYFGMTKQAETTHFWNIDADHGTATNQHGHTVRLRPFLGVVGMPPAEPGKHPTPPPRVTGGNLDCKELIAGTTLFLPVAVPGGLISVGDGHARQGDGEVSVTAIECPMKQVQIRYELLSEERILAPQARTDEGWLTLGLHEDVNEAMMQALEGMLTLMTERYVLTREDALALASVVVDLRITQIVNGVRGVHAVLPHDAVAGLEPRLGH